ncbi:MAG: ABC transporter substrate-binding protein [Deltaproteobacteria bacterium]|nr:ABC transporter substrate-binding protein [Deltaproteobacteria bacterium]
MNKIASKPSGWLVYKCRHSRESGIRSKQELDPRLGYSGVTDFGIQQPKSRRLNRRLLGHSREGGNPGFFRRNFWMPAPHFCRGSLYAGMTVLSSGTVGKLVLIACLLLTCVVLDRREGTAQVAPEKIVLSYPSVSSTGGVVPWIAKERGFFSNYGIDAELVYTSGALSMQALMGGSVDLALGSIFDPLSAISGGADIVVVGSFNNSPPYVMAARPEVRDVRDLRGRKVGVRSLTGPATAMTQFMLEEAGFDPKRDVQILRVGGTAVRLAALKDGHIDAALIDEAVAHRARESGLNIIHLKGVPHVHTGAYARRTRLQQKEAAIGSAMRALRDAAVYLKTNRAGAVQVIQKIMKLSDRQAAETAYEVLKESVVADPRIPAEVIEQSIKLAARSDARVRNVDVSKAFDMRVAGKIMEAGK